MVTTGFHKKKSKRVPARLRYKVEKKVRDHHRKQKRDAKKARATGIVKRKNQAAVIPNNVPFKDQIIQEAKQMKEHEKERKKLLKGFLRGDAKINKIINEPIASTSKKGRNSKNKKKLASASTTTAVAQSSLNNNNDDEMQCE